MKGPPGSRLAALIAAAVATVDQVTKEWALAHVPPGGSLELFPGVELVRVVNRGAAFGLFAGAAPYLGGLAAALLVGALAGRRWLDRQPAPVQVGAGFLLGGAAGNLVDRLRLGGVVDFIGVSNWPAFNLADAAIVVGAGLLAAHAANRRPEGASGREAVGQ